MIVPKPTICAEQRLSLYNAIKLRTYSASAINIMLSLPKFSEEADRFLEYLNENKDATEKEAMQKLEEICDEVTHKLGISAMDRDFMYPIK